MVIERMLLVVVGGYNVWLNLHCRPRALSQTSEWCWEGCNAADSSPQPNICQTEKVCQWEGQWCLSVYANHPWSVTEPEAVGVPGWQTGAKALCLYSQSSQACKPVRRAPTWLTTALVEWNELHTILALGAWQTLCPSQCPCWV